MLKRRIYPQGLPSGIAELLELSVATYRSLSSERLSFRPQCASTQHQHCKDLSSSQAAEVWPSGQDDAAALNPLKQRLSLTRALRTGRVNLRSD